jgi:uncharacterized protein (UPF0548 family)
VLYFSRPDRDSIDALLAMQRHLDFSYTEIGQTRGAAPAGYKLDHNRVQLGSGTEIYARAKHAVREWRMFEMPWLQLCWPESSLAVGSTVAVLAHHLGFYSLNPCRVVYVLEEDGAVEKFGFAYGTLPAHSAVGEECFTVEFDSQNGSVWYDLYAFSRPSLIAKLAYPFARALQKKFAKDSMAAMKRAVGDK